MLDVGRLCVKISGREAGNKCVIVEKINNNFVLIDGNVRRKRCNILHLEPLDKVLKIKKGADTRTVIEAMKSEGIDVKEVKRQKKKEKVSAKLIKEEKKEIIQKKKEPLKKSKEKKESKKFKHKKK